MATTTKRQPNGGNTSSRVTVALFSFPS